MIVNVEENEIYLLFFMGIIYFSCVEVFFFFWGKCNEDHVIFSSLFNGDWWMM